MANPTIVDTVLRNAGAYKFHHNFSVLNHVKQLFGDSVLKHREGFLGLVDEVPIVVDFYSSERKDIRFVKGLTVLNYFLLMVHLVNTAMSDMIKKNKWIEINWIRTDPLLWTFACFLPLTLDSIVFC